MCGGGGDIISDIGNAIEDAVQSVGDVAEQIGEIGTSVAQQAQTIGQAIIDNPLPMIETIALSSIGIPEPIAAAAVSAINGGDVRQIATSAGTAYVGGQAGQAAAGAGADPLTARIVSGATGGATRSTIAGQSLAQGITRGAIGSAAGGLVSGAVGAGPDFGGVQDYTGSEYLGEDQPLYYDTEGRALTAAEVAQLRPDLFPGGVLPGEGQQTVYTPEGKAYYEDATPIREKEGVLAKTLGTLAGRLATGLIAPKPEPRTSTTRAYTSAPGTSTTQVGTRTTSGGGSTVRTGTAALGQALRTGGAEFGTGSTGGFGAGGESLSPETGGKKKAVWNIESLRVKPEED